MVSGKVTPETRARRTEELSEVKLGVDLRDRRGKGELQEGGVETKPEEREEVEESSGD
jgi:hypothetical protein